MRLRGSRPRHGIDSNAGVSPDLWLRLSCLPACLRPGDLLRMQLFVDRPMQRDCLGPRGAVCRQSL